MTQPVATELVAESSRKRLRAQWALFICLVGLLSLFAIARTWPHDGTVKAERRTYRLDQLPFLQVDADGAEVAFGNWPDQAVRSLEISFMPGAAAAFERTLLLHIAWDPAYERLLKSAAQAQPWFDTLDGGNILDRDNLRPHGQIRRNVLRPRVTWSDDRVTLRYDLSIPAMWLKLVPPDEEILREADFEVTLVPRRSGTELALILKVVCLGLALGLVGWTVRCVWSEKLARLKPINVGIGAVAALQLLVALLLPPFQAPDEHRHWVAALRLAGRDSNQEYALFRLPELLDALPPRWLADVPFQAANFRRAAEPIGEQEPNFNVGYANYLTYPYVLLVSLFFPTVHTVPEALSFYYLCRLLPIAGWLGLLLWLRNQGSLTWLLLTFLSLPLMLQQSVAVSSDTVTLQATLAAAALFVACRRQPSWTNLSALWILVLVATWAKPPTALLLLPLFLLPWQRLPWKAVTIPSICLALLALAWFALRLGIGLLERSREDLPNRLNERLAFAFSPEGIQVFLWNVVNRFTWSSSAWLEWFQPLGWLDTDLSTWHIALVVASLAVALLADTRERYRSWLRAIRLQFVSLLALWTLVLAHFVALVLGISLIMFLTHTATEAGERYLIGVQIRYFFPAILVALIVPFGLRPAATAPGGAEVPAGQAIVLPAVLLLFTAVRAAALAIDLQLRYFG